MWKSRKRESSVLTLRGLRGTAMAMLAGVLAACGGDSFGPDDAGTSGSPEGQAPSNVEKVVDLCTRLCEGQVEGGCHVVLRNPKDCAFICSMFRDSSVSASCRERSIEAFDCQVPTPCTTSGCNDLLKEAEETCPKIPSVSG